MAGEIDAFADALDEDFVIKHDLERIFRQQMPLVLLTDSKQMFDVITRASHTSEKRLLIDVAAAREAYNRGEISTSGLCGRSTTSPTASPSQACAPHWTMSIGLGLTHTLLPSRSSGLQPSPTSRTGKGRECDSRCIV